MKVIINGFTEDIEPGTNMGGLIRMFEDGDANLIAEVNGRFVHPRDYTGFKVREGDRVELIHPAFGG